jgi:hypothetical protein
MIGIEQIAHVPSSFNVMMYSTSLFQGFQMIHHIVDPLRCVSVVLRLVIVVALGGISQMQL